MSWRPAPTTRPLAANATDVQEKAEYLLLLAELYHGLKTYDRVVRICSDIEELVTSEESLQGGDSIHEKALFLLGDAHSRMEEHASVTRTYRKALQRYPDSIYAPDITFVLGLSLMQSGRREEAVVELERFLQRYEGDANTAHALYYLGHIRFGHREFAPAINCVRAADCGVSPTRGGG